MKCTKCGNEVGNSNICLMCGYENQIENNKKESACTNKEIAIGDDQISNIITDNDAQSKKALGMKWYKFLLVSLWFGMIGNAINLFMYLSGKIYNGLRSEVYEILPTLKSLDTINEVILLFLILLGFCVWHSLKNYKKQGPSGLLVMYAVNAVSTLANLLIMQSIIDKADSTIIYGESYVSGNMIFQPYVDLSALPSTEQNIIFIIAYIVIFIANYIYFKNRKELFVN